jgi:hypothetical protein
MPYNDDSIEMDRQDPRARAAAFMERAQIGLLCDRCGGEWFYVVELSKYSADAYSAMAGGDIQPTGMTVQPIRMCACGRAVPPNLSSGRTTRGASESQQAVLSVEKIRDRADQFEADIKLLIGSSLTEEENKHLRTQAALFRAQGDIIAGLQTRVQELETASPSPVSSAPDPAFESRIVALETSALETSSAPPSDSNAGLEARVAALEALLASFEPKKQPVAPPVKAKA